MKEDYLHYAWQYQLHSNKKLTTVKGEEVEVIKPGFPHTDSGPDFKEAVLKIDGTTWFGHVEIHVKASDWIKHGHQTDPAYENVILHLVAETDQAICYPNNQEIPTVRYLDHIPKEHFEKFATTLPEKKEIPCSKSFHLIEESALNHWTYRLAVDRLLKKSSHIEKLMIRTSNDWREVTWKSCAKSFGFKSNDQAFELLADKIPVNILDRYSFDHRRIAALLLGVGGFVDMHSSPENEDLKQEWKVIKTMHKLFSLSQVSWNKSRMHMRNKPRSRLLQLAHFISLGLHSPNFINDFKNEKDLYDLMKAETGSNKYFKSLGMPEIGLDSTRKIVVNAYLPLMFYYGKNTDVHWFVDRAIDLAETIPAEQNKYTRKWKMLGWKARSILESQAQIALYQEYCSRKKCLSCTIGHQILKKKS